MHGTFKNPANPLDVAAGEGWHPYIPSLLSWRSVVSQIGHRPVLYVMRKKDGWKRLYRSCTPREAAAIEACDVNRQAKN